MDKLSGAITGHKKWIVTLFLAAALLCAVLQAGVTVNYNLTDYLPEQTQSTEALKLMEREFYAPVPNARVMVERVSVVQALEYKRQLAALDGVSDVMWLDNLVDLKIPLELQDAAVVEQYYRDSSALFCLTIAPGVEVKALDQIYQLVGDRGAVSGEAVSTASSQKMASTEALSATLILVPIILLILLLSTTSWLEPLLFLCAIGIAVLIGMGTNLFLGEVSFVTQSVSPILQMAVSLDYAIFLLHSFNECRTQTSDAGEAMRRAMKHSFPAVAASAATTLFGFFALTFMKFHIGSDLGFNLLKGIILSFLSVMVFLPALTLCCYRLLDKTRHRTFLPTFGKIGAVVQRIKIPVLILVLVLIVPSFLAQGKTHFTYGVGDASPHSRIGTDAAAIDGRFGKSTAIVLLVPRGEPARELALGEALEGLGHVRGVTSYVTAVGSAIPPEFLDPAMTQQFYSQRYARIIVDTNTDTEGAAAFTLVEDVQTLARDYYGDEVYACGHSVSLYDIKTTVTTDNKLVNLIAVLAIAAVLLVTFRSISLPLILLLTIEAAIWLNLSVPYFEGSALCYMGYLVINTVQLGATVDYAILMTVEYKRNRAALNPRQALHKTLGSSFASILVSASILAAAGFCLFATSSNTIVSQLGLLLGRGTLLSMVLVVCFLPALLTLLDPVIQKTTLRANFYKEKKL